ncbi:uncharacterized protein HMPREF1541_00125 [Cyphellophora europaea CBS 101466]|uniref:Vacuolar ATPase assembly protein VMA22 n=1 Tax=Cyphellophora europaea (strain CBS 101466) TaxID=1220924 RepID=W2SD56_CYPE1|nr:uncharacterized protein HMPREF1541_00125 [Cyphellophora europaea CBS 101466]ETN45943.1 hypothetical protein HMPREF1541_00125 [Cyphellophora europaea CBS 101466]
MSTSKTGTEHSHLPSPPASPGKSFEQRAPAAIDSAPLKSSSHSEEALEALDTLLIEYLNLLDAYTTLRTQLNSQLSQGYLSLATANRNAASVLGPGRRFGEEGFDGRMRAIRKLTIREGSSRLASIATEELDAEADNHIAVDQSAEDGNEQQPATQTQKKSQIDATEADLLDEHDTPSGADADRGPDPGPEAAPFNFSFSSSLTAEVTSKSKPKDPLKWYTALPPPALRQTQNHFTQSLDAVAELLSAQSALQAAEARVWAARQRFAVPAGNEARKEEAEQSSHLGGGGQVGEEKLSTLRLAHDHDHDDEQDEAGALNDDAEHKEPGTGVTSSFKGRQLSSNPRAPEPRSRVLKMQ